MTSDDDGRNVVDGVNRAFRCIQKSSFDVFFTCNVSSNRFTPSFVADASKNRNELRAIFSLEDTRVSKRLPFGATCKRSSSRLPEMASAPVITPVKLFFEDEKLATKPA